MLRLTGAIPVQMGDRRAAIVEILHSEVVMDTGLEGDDSDRIGSAARNPRVNHELVVDPEFDPVIGVRDKIISLRILGFDLATPTDGVSAIIGDRICGRAPKEINRRIYPAHDQVRGIKVSAVAIRRTRVGEILTC